MVFLSEHGGEIIEIVLFVLFIFISFNLIDILKEKFKSKVTSTESDATILGFLPIIDRTLKVIIAFIAVATVMQNHGYSIASLIAGFGITGLAVGFGAQVTIANVFGSFSLLADKAYKIGDYIIINQSIQDKPVEGTVEDINLRSTKIRNSNGELIIIPNNIVANGVVKNTSKKS